MTIKELANELSVSKTAINNKLIDLDLKSRCTKQGNKLVLPADVVEEIRQTFTKPKTQPADSNPGINDTALVQALREQIEMLTAHIEVLNNQLEVKDMQIERAQATNTYLLAGTTQQDLHEVEPVEVNTTEGEKTDTTTKSGGFFSKLFR